MKSFVQMIADVITNPNSDFLVLGLVVDLSRESAIFECVVN